MHFLFYSIGLLATLVMSIAALSESFASALGNSQALQGQQRNVGPFVAQIVTNETHALITLNSSKPMASAGWFAIGFGTSMTTADIILTWPNTDGSWTISHREASSHIMPTVPMAGEPPASDLSLVSYLTTNSTTSPFSMVTFLRSLTFSSAASATKSPTLTRASSQAIVYASSSQNPASSSPMANIVQHDDNAFGVTSMDLSATVTVGSSSTADSGISQANDSASWTQYDSIIVLHALCGGLAWIIFAPMAVLIARLGRNFQGWLRLHQMIQGILTATLTITAFILGIVAVNTNGGTHFSSPHTRLGLIIIILVCLQIFLGWYIHHKFSPECTHRPLRNLGHILLGCVMILAGFVQVNYGLRLYDRNAPSYVWAIYWLSLSTTVVAYLISLGRLIQSRRDMGLSWKLAAFGLGRDPLRSVSMKGKSEGDSGLAYFDQPSEMETKSQRATK